MNKNSGNQKVFDQGLFNVFDLNMNKNKIKDFVIPSSQITQLPCTDKVSKIEFNEAVQNIPTSAIFKKRTIWRPREDGTISITFCPECEDKGAWSVTGSSSSFQRPSMTLGYIDPPFRDFDFDDGSGSNTYKYRDFLTDKRNYCMDLTYPLSGNDISIPITSPSAVVYGIMDTDMYPVTLKLPKISDLYNYWLKSGSQESSFYQVFVIRDTGNASINNITIIPADEDDFFNSSSRAFTIKSDFGHVYIFTKLEIYDKNTGSGSWVTTNSTGCSKGWEAGSTVVHEFGHALGMMHEHQNDLFDTNPFEFNEEAVINWYLSRGGSEQEAYTNVLNRYTCTKEQCEYAGSRYDPESLMMYWALDSWIVGPNPIAKGNFVLSKKDKEWLSGYYPVKESSENYPNITVEFVDQNAPEWKMAWVKKMVTEEISPIVGINFTFIGHDGKNLTSSPLLNLKSNKKQMAFTTTTKPIVGDNVSLKEEKDLEYQKLSKRMEENVSLKDLKLKGTENFSQTNMGSCEMAILVVFCFLILGLIFYNLE
jgi:hypothetical protein